MGKHQVRLLADLALPGWQANEEVQLRVVVPAELRWADYEGQLYLPVPKGFVPWRDRDRAWGGFTTLAALTARGFLAYVPEDMEALLGADPLDQKALAWAELPENPDGAFVVTPRGLVALLGRLIRLWQRGREPWADFTFSWLQRAAGRIWTHLLNLGLRQWDIYDIASELGLVSELRQVWRI